MASLANSIVAKLRRSGILGIANFSISRRIAGRRYSLPVMAGNLVRPSEPWLNSLLSSVMAEKDGAFVDVGANLGQTLLKVKSIDPARQYLGFEPNPTCVAYLYKLIAKNKLEACSIVPVGISDKAGVLNLDLYGGDANPGASVIPNFRARERLAGSRAVPVLSGAELRPHLPARTAIVKIDVEGGELEVLLGLEAWLREAGPVILLEILPCYSAENTGRIDRQRAVEHVLNTLGYSLHRIRKRGARIQTFERMEQLDIHSDLDKCDYIAVPADSDIVKSVAVTMGLIAESNL